MNLIDTITLPYDIRVKHQKYIVTWFKGSLHSLSINNLLCKLLIIAGGGESVPDFS